MNTSALFIIVEHPRSPNKIGYLQFDERARARQANYLLGMRLISDPENEPGMCRPSWSAYRFSALVDEFQLDGYLNGREAERVLWQDVITGTCFEQQGSDFHFVRFCSDTGLDFLF
ncbi:MAG: hypothetical protein V4509_00250 [Patescibacteria group bacterium]